mgnify:CR=1 FL=1
MQLQTTLQSAFVSGFNVVELSEKLQSVIETCIIDEVKVCFETELRRLFGETVDVEKHPFQVTHPAITRWSGGLGSTLF